MNINREIIFSVIIPLYNKEDYIAATLASVLQQSYQSYEVIIVDDGSTDRSLEIAYTFADPRIKILKKKNEGVSSARNTAIQHARFDYIAFLDADDLWEPDYLAEMAKLISRYPGCGLYASAYRVIEKSRSYSQCADVPEGIIPDYFRTELFQQITRLSATVTPTAISRSVGGFPFGMVSGEDSYFCAKIAMQHSMAFTPKVLVSYNKDSGGISLRLGKADNCLESWFDLYEAGNYYRNEFIADKAIKAGIRYALGHHKDRSTHIEELTKYTTYSKGRWWYLFMLNRLPSAGISMYKKVKPIYKLMRSYLWQLK